MSIRILRFSLANTGRYALVPPVVAALLLVGLFAVSRGSSGAPEATYVDYSLRLLAPLFAAWWPLFAVKERIEGDGRELLYLLDPRGQAARAAALAGLFCALLVPFVALALSEGILPAATLPLALARCIFLAALAFWSAFLLRSSALALVVVLAFNVALSMQFERWAAGNGGALFAAGIYVVVTLAMLVHGELLSRKF